MANNVWSIFGTPAFGWMPPASGVTTINATPGTWSWAGLTASIPVPLISATPGTWSWAGKDAGVSSNGPSGLDIAPYIWGYTSQPQVPGDVVSEVAFAFNAAYSMFESAHGSTAFLQQTTYFNQITPLGIGNGGGNTSFQSSIDIPVDNWDSRTIIFTAYRGSSNVGLQFFLLTGQNSSGYQIISSHVDASTVSLVVSGVPGGGGIPSTNVTWPVNTGVNCVITFDASSCAYTITINGAQVASGTGTQMDTSRATTPYQIRIAGQALGGFSVVGLTVAQQVRQDAIALSLNPWSLWIPPPLPVTVNPSGATQLSAVPGTWTWTGTTQAIPTMVAGVPGSWTWTGTTQGITQLINAAPGTWAWAGTTQALTQLIAAVPGSWSWAGLDSQIVQLTTINATPGTYTWTGTTQGVQALQKQRGRYWPDDGYIRLMKQDDDLAALMMAFLATRNENGN